ncbi:alpha/beta hydrolase family protein [Actinomadura kijaniata]|uniref:alpha/beta hydrolase family protein n=1 Tax=Actinomadura kijaniata TaxID=46161 RepID=UPI0008306BA9|nr:alpha/beta fold hydrolase [Actinomadura kijaniata]
MATETDAPTAPAPAPRRRRLVRRLVAAVVALAVLAVAAVAGVGWYFSGVATEVEHGREYDLTILDAGNGTVTLPRDPGTLRPGVWGLEWSGGRAILGQVTAATATTVTRRIDRAVQGTPVKGTRAVIDHWVYAGDPKTALGLEFEQVTYPSKLGPMPAWLLPGAGLNRPWVIAVHGHNADRAETFRAMRAVQRTGLPMLSIAYRNDTGAPASPDGRNNLGHTEWNEVASAIAYARSRGATSVILYGWSMGGAMVMRTLRAVPEGVQGVVLDSPVMDWGATLDKQGADRGLPSPVTWAAKQILQLRTGIDLKDFDQRRYAARLKVPVLMYTVTEDEMVDNAPSEEFARRAPRGLVTHVSMKSDHTDGWNVDPRGYEAALDTFLRKTARP